MSKTTAEAETENERIARRVPEEMATEGRLDLAESVFAPDAVEHQIGFGDYRGPTEIRESIARMRDAFPDFSATVEDVFSDGDTVAMRVTLRGTQEGRFLGHEPSGEQFEVYNSVITRIEDGKIAERWVQPDTLGMLTQLGILSPPAEMGAA